MVEKELLNEIEKWTEKLDKKLEKIKTVDKNGKKLLENAEAYRKDSKHFLKNDKLIQSYEALIWAWAYLEIGEDLNHLDS